MSEKTITSNTKWSKMPNGEDHHDTIQSAKNICDILLNDYTVKSPCEIRGVCLDAWVEIDGKRYDKHNKENKMGKMTIKIEKNISGPTAWPANIIDCSTCEDALNAIKLIKELKSEGYFTPEHYRVRTPVTPKGYVIFDNGEQAMRSTIHGALTVIPNVHLDSRHLFVWVPIKRQNLQPGDVAYHTTSKDPKFNLPHLVCCVVDKDCVWANNDRIDEIAKLRRVPDPRWYKLTKKSDLGIEISD